MTASALTRAEKLVRFHALREELGARPATGGPALCGAGDGWVDLLLQRGAVSEFAGPPGGASLVLCAVLDAVSRGGGRLALVDAGCMFEPEDWPDDALGRMLWVMAPDAKRAVRAADLLVRDGNLPVLVLDLHGLDDREIRSIPSNAWHRFHRLMEAAPTALAVLTKRPTVEGARFRLETSRLFGLDDLERTRTTLLSHLCPQATRGTAPDAHPEHLERPDRPGFSTKVAA